MLEAGQVFSLENLISVPETGIARALFASSPDYRVVLHALRAGEKVAPHPAPGKALVIALEGSGMMDYEGKKSVMHAGDSMIFDKGGLHGVEGLEDFKFVVLLSLAS